MPRPRAVVLDDRLLIEELLVGLDWGRRRADVSTTTYWCYRACRAAVVGGGGHLSGPFSRVADAVQEEVILGLLRLPDRIGLPPARETVPVMAEVARRHPQLNVLNVEAAAAARVLGAEVWCSPPAAAGLLAGVLDAEEIPWRTVEIA